MAKAKCSLNIDEDIWESLRIVTRKNKTNASQLFEDYAKRYISENRAILEEALREKRHRIDSILGN